MTPNQLATVTNCSIKGMTTRAIGDVVGVSNATVSRTLNKPEIRAKIEAAAERIVNGGVEDAVDTVLRLSKRGKDTEDKDWAKLGLDASKLVLAIPGIHGNAPSTVINALIQVNQAPQQTAEVQALQQFMQQMWACSSDEHQEITGIPATHTPVMDAPIDIPSEAISDDAEAVDN